MAEIYAAIIFIPLQESCRRYLQFTVPRVVAVSPQMRLVEDNTSNISLADVFKQVLYVVYDIEIKNIPLYP